MPEAAPPGIQPERTENALFRKRYVVVGPKEVGGVKAPGAVELELTRAQEEHLIETGHIKPAPPARVKPEEKEED